MIRDIPLTRCTCGQLYFSEAWSQAHLVGYVPSGRDGAGELLELRLCESCGSKLFVDCGEQPDTRSAESLGRLVAEITQRRVSRFPITLMPERLSSIPPGDPRG